MRPTCADIALRALVANYALLLDAVQHRAGVEAGLIAVVKADAYGHGVAACGRALAEAGAPWLGVTSVDEALVLKAALGRLRPRLLVMSGFFPGEEGAVLGHHLTPQVWESYHFALLDAAARRAGLGRATVPVHLEIDTGMARQGVAPGAALKALLGSAGFERDSPLFVEGVLTHFSSPEELGKPMMAGQMARLRAAMAQLHEAGLQPRWVHAGNSANAGGGVGLDELAAVARESAAELLVRPGLSLYGIDVHFSPGAQAGPATVHLEPVMRWRAEITTLRDVPGGAVVGYNETFRTAQASRLALVPVGYADGLNRLLSNRGSMLVRGRRAPIVGRISMDQTVLDVSAIEEAALGDEVVILGRQGGEAVTAWEMAGLCGTIPYEVVCAVNSRVRRNAESR